MISCHGYIPDAPTCSQYDHAGSSTHKIARPTPSIGPPYRRGRHLRFVTLDSPRCAMKQDYRRPHMDCRRRWHITRGAVNQFLRLVFKHQPDKCPNVPIMSCPRPSQSSPHVSPPRVKPASCRRQTIKRWLRLAATPSMHTASSSAHILDRALHPLSPLSIKKSTDPVYFQYIHSSDTRVLICPEFDLSNQPSLLRSESLLQYLSTKTNSSPSDGRIRPPFIIAFPPSKHSSLKYTFILHP
jgi:hypothetical protein